VQVGAAGAALDAVLWRRQPILRRLRPTLPGAVLSDVRLLSSGDLALSIALPARRQVQAWRLEPRSGAVQPLLTDAADTRLAVTPDGQVVALVGYPVGPPTSGGDLTGFGAPPASVVWLVGTSPAAPMAGWRAPLLPDEQVVDVSWNPRADRLLVVTTQVLPGVAARSRLWLVEVDGLHAQQMMSLPSEVVPGSDVWSPDGQRVLFVARAGALNALCLLDLQGEFRYVADLDLSPVAPLGFPPATWSADSQRLLFVAPRQHPPGAAAGWLQSEPRHVLYVADVADPAPALIGETDVDLAVWREDGQLIGLGRGGNDGALDVRLLGGSGGSQHVLELPLKPVSSTPFAAVWDVPRARLLVASPTSSGGTDFWLVMLGQEGER
jgi:dipeptidyl aminopeptidase/acylaminoacyl peptidase